MQKLFGVFESTDRPESFLNGNVLIRLKTEDHSMISMIKTEPQGIRRRVAIVLVSAFFLQQGIAADTQNPVDHQKQYEGLLTLASGSNPKAKHDLFIYVYEHSSSLRSHRREAMNMLIESAKLGYTDAQYNLGYMLMTGTWVDANDAEGVYWLTTAANKGHLSAQLWCGEWFLDRAYGSSGDMRAEYLSVAMDFLRYASDAERPDSGEVLEARRILGLALIRESVTDFEGWGLVQSAAMAGHAPAQESMAELVEMLNDAIGEGFDEARVLLDKYGGVESK